MKIVAVATLISPRGEYGGPVRVAVNQLRALRERGHEVLLVAGARGFAGSLPTVVEGVPAALFPVRSIVPRSGFAGLTSPRLLAALRRLLSGSDIVHIHAARDLITLPVAEWCRRTGRPYVLQTHGMIDPTSRALARPLDRWLTRPVLRGARTVLHLTPVERRSLMAVGAPATSLQPLDNGVPEAPAVIPPAPVEVLYLARLAARKRPGVFVDAAADVAPHHPEVRFRLVGPDEGVGAEVEASCARAREAGVDISWEGALAPERTGERMASAHVYVLPSVDEPYPMSVLEAMAHGLPVIITDTCGLAPAVRSSDAGIVVDDSPSSLAKALDRLLADRELARAMGDRGRVHVRRNLSMSAIAVRLEAIYR